jgi:hypothetical protein
MFIGLKIKLIKNKEETEKMKDNWLKKALALKHVFFSHSGP